MKYLILLLLLASCTRVYYVVVQPVKIDTVEVKVPQPYWQQPYTEWDIDTVYIPYWELPQPKLMLDSLGE